MNYIIKKLNGKSDAHTKLRLELGYYFLPVYFRIFDNTVICMAPLKFKNAILKSINDIPIETLLKKLMMLFPMVPKVKEFMKRRNPYLTQPYFIVFHL